jgi:hypothetical protein
VEQSGGATAIRDLGALESAVAQPRMTFGVRRGVLHRFALYLSAVVNHGSANYLYRGIVADFTFDGDGRLDTVSSGAALSPVARERFVM